MPCRKSSPDPNPAPVDAADMDAAVDLLLQSKRPGIFAGWGCRDCTDRLIRLAEMLEAPVATTLQGLSVFPADHPLHTGMGFGISAVPAAEHAFKDCDCMIAVGTRFGEIPTGSFGVEVPDNLIHIDIDPDVFNRNYPAKVAIAGDAGTVLDALLKAMERRGLKPFRNVGPLRGAIRTDKRKYMDEWRNERMDRVNPTVFFERLRKVMAEDAILVADDGNHTFLAAELSGIGAAPLHLPHGFQLHGLLRSGRHRRQTDEPRQTGGGHCGRRRVSHDVHGNRYGRESVGRRGVFRVS